MPAPLSSLRRVLQYLLYDYLAKADCIGNFQRNTVGNSVTGSALAVVQDASTRLPSPLMTRPARVPALSDAPHAATRSRSSVTPLPPLRTPATPTPSPAATKGPPERPLERRDTTSGSDAIEAIINAEVRAHIVEPGEILVCAVSCLLLCTPTGPIVCLLYIRS